MKRNKTLGILAYLAKRLLYLIAVFFGVSIFTFIVTLYAPGGTISSSPVDGSPLYLRYLAWLRVVILGQTAGAGWPRSGVFFYFGKMVPGTILLTGASLLVIVLISLPLGMITALKKNSKLDYIVRFLSFFGASIPNFTIALVLIFTLVVGRRWFSLIGDGEIKSMVLPVCALAIPLISGYVRHIRGVTLEELNQNYVAGAMARGISKWRITVFHLFPNLLPSMLAYMGVSIGRLLSSVAIIETIFMWRGIGTLAVTAIRTHDYQVIQAYVLWMALLYITIRFVVDTVSSAVNLQLRRNGVI